MTRQATGAKLDGWMVLVLTKQQPAALTAVFIAGCALSWSCRHVAAGPPQGSMVTRAELQGPPQTGLSIGDCVERARIVGAPAKLTYRVTIDVHGRAVLVDHDGGLPPGLAACLAEAYSTLVFSPARDRHGHPVLDAFEGRLHWNDVGIFVEYPGGEIAGYLGCLSDETSQAVPCGNQAKQ